MPLHLFSPVFFLSLNNFEVCHLLLVFQFLSCKYSYKKLKQPNLRLSEEPVTLSTSGMTAEVVIASLSYSLKPYLLLRNCYSLYATIVARFAAVSRVFIILASKCKKKLGLAEL